MITRHFLTVFRFSFKLIPTLKVWKDFLMMDVMTGMPKLSPEAAKQYFLSKFDTTIGNLRTFLKHQMKIFPCWNFASMLMRRLQLRRVSSIRRSWKLKKYISNLIKLNNIYVMNIFFVRLVIRLQSELIHWNLLEHKATIVRFFKGKVV